MTTVLCFVASTHVFVAAIKAAAAWVVGLKRPLFGVKKGGKGAPATDEEAVVAAAPAVGAPATAVDAA